MIYCGIVEDRVSDPLKLGRCKVRISGIHTDNKIALPSKDLPWAVIMQPTTSSAMSGVGFSPTGIVEGSLVLIMFRDEYQQMPIIIGTIPGVPTKEEIQEKSDSSTEYANAVQSKGSTQPSNAVTSGDGTAITDGSGQPITSGESPAPVKEEEPIKDEKRDNNARRPSELSTSAAGFGLIRKKEGLASIKPGVGNNPFKGGMGNDSTNASTKIYSYQDIVGKWTIGWGSTYLEDMKTEVTETTTRTKAECDNLLKIRIQKDDEPAIRKLVTVPITQSMFDACISMIYNMGRGNFAKSAFRASLNAGKYAEAAALIPETNNLNGKLRDRREIEKAHFLKDGIPQDDGSIQKNPIAEKTAPDATQNPVVIRDGRFDDNNSNNPGVVQQLNEPGFADPNARFPLYLNEPDTHRLARNEKIDGTIVYKKECARVKGVGTADGGSWDQPSIPYNTKYPYNKVFATESGHVQEWDDTPGNERIHQYHKSGTFNEIDVNGTQVNRIVGDSFQILERNGNVLIKGTCNITIQGNGNIRVENNANIEAFGDMNIKAGGNIGIGAGGNIRLSAGGEVSADGSAVHLNSGKGGGVQRAGGSADGVPEFPQLAVPTRHDDLDATYESPDEGEPPEEFRKKLIESGKLDPDAPAGSGSTASESVTDLKKENSTSIPTSCDAIMKETDFTWNYRLSENFTLKNTVVGSNPELPSMCYGKSAAEIVCNLKHLAVNVLEPIRSKYPNMIITNTWRSEKKNNSLKGASKTSKHMTGQAVDIQFQGFNKRQTFNAAIEIQKLLGSFDQIIVEYSGPKMWIHIGFCNSGNRNQCLTMQIGDTTIKQQGFHLHE
jgi:GH24 family phage-related lysozyme (muramidase)